MPFTKISIACCYQSKAFIYNRKKDETIDNIVHELFPRSKWDEQLSFYYWQFENIIAMGPAYVSSITWHQSLLV